MHALPSHPRHPLVAGLVALMLALLGLAATAVWPSDPLAPPVQLLAGRP